MPNPKKNQQSLLDDKLPIMNSLSYLNAQLSYAAYMLKNQTRKLPNAKQIFGHIKKTKDLIYSFSLVVEESYKVTKKIVSTLEVLALKTFSILRSFNDIRHNASSTLQLFANFIAGRKEELQKVQESKVEKPEIHEPEHENSKHKDHDNRNPFAKENYYRNTPY